MCLPERSGESKGMVCAMEKFSTGPARWSASLTAEAKKKSRVNDALSSSTLPSHSKASIRIKADEKKKMEGKHRHLDSLSTLIDQE